MQWHSFHKSKNTTKRKYQTKPWNGEPRWEVERITELKKFGWATADNTKKVASNLLFSIYLGNHNCLKKIITDNLTGN